MITTVDELGSVLANVTPTAAAMGVSFEEVSTALANMTAQGTATGQATTQLNGLLAELGKEGTKASTALSESLEGTEHAGKTFQDLVAEGVPLNEILDMLGKHAEETGVGMLDMFGSIEAGKAALALSGKNSEKYAQTLDKMKNSSGSVDKAFKTVSNTTKEKMDKMMNQLKNTMIKLFDVVEPIITMALPILMDLFTQLAPVIQQVFEKISPLIERALPLFMGLIESLLPPLLMLFDALLPIVDILIAILEPVLQLATAILGPLIEAISLLIKLALKPVMLQLNMFKNVFGSVLNGIQEHATRIIGNIVNIFKSLIDFIKNVFTGNWKGAWGNIKDIFASIWDSLKASAIFPLNAIISAVNGVLKGLNGIKIPDWVPGVGGKGFSIKTIPKIKLAKGGLAFGETDATVGDNPNARHDPEVIAPLSKLKSELGLDGSNVNNNSMNNQNIVFNITGNTISDEMDINNIGDMLTRKLQNEGVL